MHSRLSLIVLFICFSSTLASCSYFQRQTVVSDLADARSLHAAVIQFVADRKDGATSEYMLLPKSVGELEQNGYISPEFARHVASRYSIELLHPKSAPDPDFVLLRLVDDDDRVLQIAWNGDGSIAETQQ